MEKKYIIKLDDKQIGISKFEKADPPMGVIGGKIIFNEIQSAYEFFNSYCKETNIAIHLNDRETRAISTGSIEGLKAFAEDGTEIKGIEANIEGCDDEYGYEIIIIGIAYPFYEREFPNWFS